MLVYIIRVFPEILFQVENKLSNLSLLKGGVKVFALSVVLKSV